MRSCITKLLLGVVAVAAFTVPAFAVESTRAVWQVQEITMPYFGFTTHYSCDGLHDKMREILKQLGVRQDFQVSISGCTELNGPVRSPTVHILMANAVPANDEVTKTLAADPKRGELLARLQRKSKTPFSDEPFDATLAAVTLRAKDRNYASAVGDCELLEQVRRDILPKLGAKILKDEVRCTPHQGIVGNPRIELELWMAAPQPKR